MINVQSFELLSVDKSRSFLQLVNGKGVETVKSAKLLGVTISDDLSWNEHVSEAINKPQTFVCFGAA